MGSQLGSLAFGIAGAALGFFTFGTSFAISAGFLGGVLLYAAVLGNKQGDKASAIKDILNFPTSAEGSPVPVIFGRQKISSFCIGMSDFKSQTRSVGGGSGLGQPKSELTTYTFDVAMLACFGPIDRVNDVLVSKDTIWGHGPLNFSDGEPTIISTQKGNMAFYWGVDNQEYSDYMIHLNAISFPTANYPPRYNWYCYYTFDNFDLNTTPQYPAVMLDITRFPKTSIATDPNVGTDDANPALSAFEILTNPVWGCSLPEGYIDVEAFKMVAEQLKDEGLGISFTLDSTQTAISVLSDIANATNMFFFINTEGQISVVLRRENQVFTEDNYIVIDDRHILPGSLQVSSPSISGLSNQLKIQWTNIAKSFIANTVVLNNAASQQAYGLRFENVNLSMLTTADNAAKQGNRILIQKSLPLRQAQFECNKYTTRPWVGRYILLSPGSWAESDSILMFITQVEETELQNGTVKVTAVEDRLSFMTSVSFGGTSSVVSSGDVNPLHCITRYRLYELPVGLNTADLQVVAVAGQDPNSATSGYVVWAKPALSANLKSIAQRFTYVPAGTLGDDIFDTFTQLPLEQPFAECVVVLDGYNDDRVESVTESEWRADYQLMLVHDELISIRTWQHLGDNRYKITGMRRNVLGSIGRDHGAGTDVYFIRSIINTNNFITSQEFAAGSSWEYLILPTSNVASLSIADCATKTFTFSN